MISEARLTRSPTLAVSAFVFTRPRLTQPLPGRGLVFENRHNVCNHFLVTVVAPRLIATQRVVKHFQQAAVTVGARAFWLVATFREHLWEVWICEQGSRHCPSL